LDLILKREAEEECYIFTNECYLDGGFGYRGDTYKLRKGIYQVCATVFYETGIASAWFCVENLGTGKDSVKVMKLEV